MTKDVVVSLKGLQLAPDQQSDAVGDCPGRVLYKK